MAAALCLADTARAERWVTAPSVSVAAVYDDNLFLGDPPRSAMGLRVGPALAIGYQPSARLMFEARVGAEAEYYGDPEVTQWVASRSAVLGGRYRVWPTTTVSLTGSYVLTSRPGELLPSAGVSYGRGRAEGVGGELTVEHRFGPKLTLRTSYGIQAYWLEHRRRAVDSQLGGDASVVLLVAPRTTLTLKSGPRYVQGSLSPHVGASVERTMERAQVSFGYERGKNQLLDRAAVIESYTVRLSHRLSRKLSVAAAPGLYRYWEGFRQRRSWGFSANASYRAGPTLSAFARYEYSAQEAVLTSDRRVLDLRGRALARNAVVAGFTIARRHVEATTR